MFLILLAGRVPGQSGGFDWVRDGAPLHASYPGILRVHAAIDHPRLMKINCLRVDLRTPGLQLYTTGRIAGWVDNDRETLTRTTRGFIAAAREDGLQIAAAINAAAWNFTNTAAVPANLLGLAVSEGTLVSAGQAGYPSFVVTTGGIAKIVHPLGTQAQKAIRTAVSGFRQVLRNGEATGDSVSLHPRTGIGVSADGRYVFLMTVDGRADEWSQGATEYDVGAWLRHFGAADGLNMDGGGSSTLAWWNPASGASELLNVPRGSVATSGTPPVAEERRVGNSLGVRYVAPDDSAEPVITPGEMSGRCTRQPGRSRLMPDDGLRMW